MNKYACPTKAKILMPRIIVITSQLDSACNRNQYNGKI